MKKVALLCALFIFVLSAGVMAKAKGHLEGVMNVNEAGVEQLTLLPGVGQKRAEEIIAVRQKTPFKKVDDLKNIKGIGDKSLETLRPFVAVSGPTTATWVKE